MAAYKCFVPFHDHGFVKDAVGFKFILVYPLLILTITPILLLVTAHIVVPSALIRSARPWQHPKMDHNRKQTASVEGNDAQADRESH